MRRRGVERVVNRLDKIAYDMRWRAFTAYGYSTAVIHE